MNINKNLAISAVIITKNEEKIISQCLESLYFCNEIVVLDSFSTDNTEEICSKYNVKFFKQEFLGFGKQKEKALSFATNPWILSLDADEVITPMLAKEIQKVLLSPETYAFFVPRTLVFMGHTLLFCGENKRPVLRLFHKDYFGFDQAIVHEEVISKFPSDKSKNSIKNLSSEILHYSYKDWSDYIEKMNLYTGKMAIKALNRRAVKMKIKAFKPSIRFLSTFFKIYILKLGFLDGISGLNWSITCAYANFLKYAKVNEILSKK